MPAFVLVDVASERVAVPAEAVERVLRMAAVAPLHGAPREVEGVLDVHGELVPVIDVRARLGHAPRPARPEDHLVLASRASGRVALHVDRVVELVTVADAEYESPGRWSAGAELVSGAVKLPGGVVVVHSVQALARPADAEGAAEGEPAPGGGGAAG